MEARLKVLFLYGAASMLVGTVLSVSVTFGLLLITGAKSWTLLEWLPRGTVCGAALVGPPYAAVGIVSALLALRNRNWAALFVGVFLPISYFLALGLLFPQSKPLQEYLMWFSAPFLLTPMLVGGLLGAGIAAHIMISEEKP